jgi:hypothetical protein
VTYALNNTWHKYVNVDFLDEGNCLTAPHASTSIHIHGWDRLGAETENADGMPALGTEASVIQVPRTEGALAQTCPGTSTNLCFEQIIAHEFGHILGFDHEYRSVDFDLATCPDLQVSIDRANHPLANTVITAYDLGSIMNYCTPVRGAVLTTMDIAGATAMFGATNKAQGTAYVAYGKPNQNSIRFQANSRWLQPTETGAVGTQSFVGELERIYLNQIGEAHADGFVHYGDEVSVSDRFGRYLSGRDDDGVDMQPSIQARERWLVESIEPSYPAGSRLQVNAPLRLRNIQWNKWIGVSSGGDALLTSETSDSELRVNGGFVNK